MCHRLCLRLCHVRLCLPLQRLRLCCLRLCLWLCLHQCLRLCLWACLRLLVAARRGLGRAAAAALALCAAPRERSACLGDSLPDQGAGRRRARGRWRR